MLDLSIISTVFGLEYKIRVQLPNKKFCGGTRDFLVLSTENCIQIEESNMLLAFKSFLISLCVCEESLNISLSSFIFRLLCYVGNSLFPTSVSSTLRVILTLLLFVVFFHA
jgi:hypothetical protein